MDSTTNKIPKRFLMNMYGRIAGINEKGNLCFIGNKEANTKMAAFIDENLKEKVQEITKENTGELFSLLLSMRRRLKGDNWESVFNLIKITKLPTKTV